MTFEGASKRHLSREGLEQYLSTGAPSVLRIEGNPTVYLIVEPMVQRLALRTPLTRHSLPDVSAYQYISVAKIHWNDTGWFEICVDGAVVREGYPVLCAIADRIQVDGIGFDVAVSDALSAFREVFSKYGRFSFEEEIGLFGELLLLNHLLDRSSPSEALPAWRGPDGEEHDFDISGNDVEVKCTAAEARIHWINDGRQLEPTRDRPLWLLSIQLTNAGEDGLSISDLISQTFSKLLLDARATDLFASKLSAVGWREESPLLYTCKYRLRTQPALYAVDAGFPSLTWTRLSDAGFNLAPVVQIRYALNLSQLPQAETVPQILQDMGTGR